MDLKFWFDIFIIVAGTGALLWVLCMIVRGMFSKTVYTRKVCDNEVISYFRDMGWRPGSKVYLKWYSLDKKYEELIPINTRNWLGDRGLLSVYVKEEICEKDAVRINVE